MYGAVVVIVVVVVVVVYDGAYEGRELHWMRRRFRILLDNSYSLIIASKQESESSRWLQGRINLKFSMHPNDALNC